MISVLAVSIGILFPTVSGTLLVLLLEGQTRVLLRSERIALGCAFGLALTMTCTMYAHLLLHVALSLALFLWVQAVLLLVVLVLTMLRKLHRAWLHHPPLPQAPAQRWLTILLSFLVAWVVIRALAIATVSLLLTPSFYDDTLSNWNLRGKVFYVTQSYSLVLPNENPASSPLGVSSYPPTVPLLKTWLAELNGEWTDGVVNSIHIVWYLCALVLVYGLMRRRTSRTWALLAVYVLGSMPLYLMHGTSAYADAFVSVHVFAAMSMLFSAVFAETQEARLAFLRLGALAAALLPLTKNEGLMVYLPPLLLLVALSLGWMHRKGRCTRTDVVRSVAWYIGCLFAVALPFLAFKWAHGLTFGNGKPLASLAFGWQQYVLLSLYINTLFEGNWLFLFPLLIALLLWRWRTAWTTLFLLTAFFLTIYFAQILLYLFTSLSTEALRQTGYGRGLVHLMPVIIVLTTLLLKDALASVKEVLHSSTLAGSEEQKNGSIEPQ